MEVKFKWKMKVINTAYGKIWYIWQQVVGPNLFGKIEIPENWPGKKLDLIKSNQMNIKLMRLKTTRFTFYWWRVLDNI